MNLSRWSAAVLLPVLACSEPGLSPGRDAVVPELPPYPVAARVAAPLTADSARKIMLAHSTAEDSVGRLGAMSASETITARSFGSPVLYDEGSADDPPLTIWGVASMAVVPDSSNPTTSAFASASMKHNGDQARQAIDYRYSGAITGGSIYDATGPGLQQPCTSAILFCSRFYYVFDSGITLPAMPSCGMSVSVNTAHSTWRQSALRPDGQAAAVAMASYKSAGSAACNPPPPSTSPGRCDTEGTPEDPGPADMSVGLLASAGCTSQAGGGYAEGAISEPWVYGGSAPEDRQWWCMATYTFKSWDGGQTWYYVGVEVGNCWSTAM